VSELPQVIDQPPLALFEYLPGLTHTDPQRTGSLYDLAAAVMDLYEYSAVAFGKRSDYIDDSL
jgi:hypothetical protein